MRGDGVLELDARYSIRTHDGVEIAITNRGLRRAAPSHGAHGPRRGRGSRARLFPHAPVFEAPAGPLNGSIAASSSRTAARLPDKVQIRVFEVLLSDCWDLSSRPERGSTESRDPGLRRFQGAGSRIFRFAKFRDDNIMTTPSGPRFDTLACTPASGPTPTTGARAVPIYQTTSFVFDDTEHAAALFNLERAGHIYSRISNPTVAVLEERISALEGGVGAVATASGQAALHLMVATLMGAGGHIVASARIYGGSHNMFMHTLPRFGITTTLVDPRDPDELRRGHHRPERALVFAETLGNPGLEVLDIAAVADGRPQAQACRLLSIPPSPRPTCAGPSSTAPTSSCIPPPSSWAGHGIAIGGIVDRWRPLRLGRRQASSRP